MRNLTKSTYTHKKPHITEASGVTKPNFVTTVFINTGYIQNSYFNTAVILQELYVFQFVQ